MTALAADAYNVYESGEINDLPVKAATTIYQGAAAGDDAAGYMRGLVAGDPFRGFALVGADNASGSAGDIKVNLQAQGKIKATITSVAITDVGNDVYMSDDATFTQTATGNSRIGTIYRYVTTNTCIVAFAAAGSGGADSQLIDTAEIRDAAISTAKIAANAVDTVIAADKNRSSGMTVTTDTTAGAYTMLAAVLLGGLILRDPAGGARSDPTDTAENIVGAMDNPQVGDSFLFTIRNTADAAETITVTAGTDVTLSGTMTIAQNNSKTFRAVCTNVTAASEAVTVYSLGTVVH